MAEVCVPNHRISMLGLHANIMASRGCVQHAVVAVVAVATMCVVASAVAVAGVGFEQHENSVDGYGPMPLTLFPDAGSRRAVCNDNSSAGYTSTITHTMCWHAPHANQS